MSTNLLTPVHEFRVEGRRLGRHINHDPRSRDYQIQPRRANKSVTWARTEAPFTQLHGSCTIHAGVGVLATAPFVGTFTTPSNLFTEDYMEGTLYKWETENDPFPGSWPTEDTGSDGLSSAKTMQHFGFIGGYQHAMSIDALITGLQERPGIVGTNWLANMDTPDGQGMLQVSGAVRGGHEYECFMVDLATNILGFWNSWGFGWGNRGRMYMTISDFTRLLAQGGDATFFTPLGSPAPTPTPGPVSHSFTAAQDLALKTWADKPHVFHNATVASKAWKEATK